MDYSAFTCVYLVAQSCLPFCNPWTVAHQAPLSMGVLQARILEWVIMSSSRGSSQPRDWTQVSCIADGFFTYSTLLSLFILFKLSWDLSIESSFQCPFTFSIIFWAFPYFLAPPDSFSNFLAPTPNEFSHFIKDPWFLVLKKWYLETKI